MIPLKGNQGAPSPFSSPIALDYRGINDPGRELSLFGQAIQKKIEADEAFRRKSNESIDRGFYAFQGIDKFKKALADATVFETRAREKAQPVIDRFYKDTLGEDDVNFGALTTRDKHDNIIPHDGLIQERANNFSKLNGGDGNVALHLAAQLTNRVVYAIKKGETDEVYAKKVAALAKSGQALFPTEESTKKAELEVFATTMQAADTVHNLLTGRYKSFGEKKQAEYKPLIAAVEEKYGSLQKEIQQTLVNDETTNAQFAIDQYKQDLDGAVSRGEIMAQSAQFRMDNFVKETYDRLNTNLQSDEFNNRAVEAFEIRYGEAANKEMDALNQRYQAEMVNKKKEYDNIYRRAIKELQNISDTAQFKLKNRGVSQEGLNQLRQIYGEAFNEVMAKEHKKRSAQVQLDIDLARKSLGVTPIAAMKFTEFFGDNFMMNVGNMMKSKAMYLNSLGVDGAWVDWLKQEGGTLFSENFSYTPEFKMGNFLSPAVWGTSMAQIAYSIPSLVSTLALSRMGLGSMGWAAYGVAQTADNAAINSGDTYWQAIQNNPNDIAGARQAAQKVFALHMLDLPMNMLIGKMWFPAKKGSLLKKIGERVTGSAAEYVTESYESASQNAVLNPKNGLVSDTFENWKSKEAQAEGIMAGFGTMLTGGMGPLGSKMSTMLLGKANPGTQFIAQMMFDRSPSYARAIFAGSESEYGEKTFAEIGETMNRIEGVISEAKAMNLSRPQTLAYVELTEKIQQEKNKLSNVSTPAAKAFIESNIKNLEAEVGKLIDGKTNPVTVSMPGTDVVINEEDLDGVLEDEDIQVAVTEGTINIQSEDRKVNEKVEAMKMKVAAAVLMPEDNKNDQTVVGVGVGEAAVKKESASTKRNVAVALPKASRAVDNKEESNIAITEKQVTNEEGTTDVSQGQEAQRQEDVLTTPAQMKPEAPQPVEFVGEQATEATEAESSRAKIEKRRKEELSKRVVYDIRPTVEDGEFMIVGDPNQRTFRINENTGRPQVLDKSNGLWSNTEMSPNMFFETTKRSGFIKSKDKINAKYDAELSALENTAQMKPEAPQPVEFVGEAAPALGSEDVVVEDDKAKEARKTFNAKYDQDMATVTRGAIPGGKMVTSLTPEGKKKKLDAMTRRLIDAKNEGIISESEFSDKYDDIAQAYQKLAEKNPQFKAAASVAASKAKEAVKNPFAITEKLTFTADNIEDLDEKKFSGVQKKVVRDVKNVVSAITDLVKKATGSNVSVNLYKGDEAFGDAVVEAGGDRQNHAGAKGFYIAKDGSIHINMARANTTTVLHEGFHPALDYIAEKNPAKLDELYNDLAKSDVGKAFIKSNNKAYTGSTTQKKEAITDFIAHVADGRIVINPSNFQKVKNVVMSILKKMGFDVTVKGLVDMKNANQLRELAKMISEKFTSGDEVSDNDLAVFIKNDGQPGSVAAAGSINPDNIDAARGVDNPLQFNKTNLYKKEKVSKILTRTMQDLYNEYKKVVIINSDPTRVGPVKYPSGREVFMYGGPGYTALEKNVNNNVGFASTELGKATFANNMLKSLFPDGRGPILVMTQSPTSMMGNAYALDYVLDAISLLDSKVLNSSEFKAEFFGTDLVAIKDAFGKKYESFQRFAKENLGDPKVIRAMMAELLSDIGANFMARNALVDNLIAGITSTTKAAKEKGGYVSVDPQKYIAKQLYDKFGLNQEKLFYDLGVEWFVKKYMDESKWGYVASGFIGDANVDFNTIQDKGIIHPQFNSKFYGTDPFLLDGAYHVDKLIEPVVMTHSAKGKEYVDPKTGQPKPYVKRASMMAIRGIYPGGEVSKIEKEGQLQFSKAQEQFTKKAPNGNPSNLNDRQWEQVRTPKFKAWFGDWENDPANASKIVDENGEPLVVYHGSPHTFDKFMESPGYYFTDNKDVAETYRNKKYKTVPQTIEAFLNIRNLETIDANGADFNKIPVVFNSVENGEYKKGSLTTDEIVHTVIGARFPTLLGQHKKPDGVRINNVKDSHFSGPQRVSNLFIALQPNQIKSATNNFGSFNPNDDRIQFAKTDTPEFKAWFGDGNVVDENGNPKVLYHGSKNVFDEMKPRFDDGMVFLTSNPEFASNWMKGIGGIRERKTGESSYEAFREESRKYREQNSMPEDDAAYEEWRAKDPGRFSLDADTNIYPVYTNAKMFNPANDEDFNLIYPTLVKKYGSEKKADEMIKNGGNRANWFHFEDKMVTDKLRELGFGGVWLSEKSDRDATPETAAIFAGPGSIKSAIANTGAFDANDNRLQFSKSDAIVFDDAMTEAARMIEDGASIQDAETAAIEYTMANMGGNYTEKEIRNLVRQYMMDYGLAPQEGDNVKKTIDENMKRKTEKGTLNLRSLFKKIYDREKNTLDAIKEVQAEVTRYFKANAVAMDSDLVAEVMNKINALVNPDITFEDIEDALQSVEDAIKLQANRDREAKKGAEDKSFGQRLIDIALAKQETAEAIKEIQEEITKYFKQNGLDLKKKGVVNIMKQLTRLAEAGDNAQTLWDVLSNIDTVIAEQEKADMIDKVRDTQKKFKKFLKASKYLALDYRTKLNSLLRMMPSPVLMAATGADMEQYVEAMTSIMTEYGNKQNIRTMTMRNLDYMTNKLRAITKDIADYLDAKSLMRYNAERKQAFKVYARNYKNDVQSGKILPGSTRFEFPAYEEWMEQRQDMADLETLESKTERSAEKGKDFEALLALVELQQERLKDLVSYLGDGVRAEMSDVMDRLINVDRSLLREKEARHLISIINNIVNDGNVQGAMRFLAFQDAQKINEEIRNNPMRIRGTWAQSARAFGNLLQSLTFNRTDAARLRSLFGDVTAAANRVQRMLYGFSHADGRGVIDDVYRIAKKMGKDKPLANFRVGVFQFLNQAMEQPSPDAMRYDQTQIDQRTGLQEFNDQRVKENMTSKQADFERRLNNLIDGTIINLYNYAAANLRSGGTTAKAMMDQAMKVADTLQQFGLIEGYAVVTDAKGNKTMEVTRKNEVSLDGLYDKLDGNEKELYDYVREKFADPEFLDKMKQVSEGLHGIPFNAIDNYAPQIAHTLSDPKASAASEQINNIGDMNFRGDGARKVGVRPSDRFLQRTRLADPTKHYYSMDAISNFLTGYYEANLSIEGGEALKRLSYVLNGQDFKKLMNGVFNKAIDGIDLRYEKLDGREQYGMLLERFAEILRDTANPPFLGKDQRGAVAKAFEYTLSGVTATYLQTSDQVLKQLLPNLAAGVAAVGMTETMQATRLFFQYKMGGTTEEREAFREFMRNFEGDFRSPMGEAAFDELNKLMEDYDVVYRKALALSNFKDQYTPARIGKWIFKNSDKVAYGINVISAYIDAEIKAGRLKSAFDFDLEAMQNVNKQSVSDALNMAEMLNNASKSAERAPYTRMRQTDRNIKDQFIRNVMFLKGFSLNSFMGFQNNLAIALSSSGRATTDEKLQAGRRAMSYVAQIAIFNMLKVYMISPAFNILGDVLIANLFGTDLKDEPELEKRKRMAKRASQFWHNSAADALVGYMPSPVELGAKGMYNWLYSEAKQARFEAYKGDPEGAQEMFGRPIPQSLKFESKAAKQLLKGTTLETRYNPFFIGDNSGIGSMEVYADLGKSFRDAFTARGGTLYSEETNKNLDKMDVAKMMAYITGQGDALKIMYGMERQLKFHDKLGGKPKSGSNNPIKDLQKKFKSDAFKGLQIKPKGI